MNVWVYAGFTHSKLKAGNFPPNSKILLKNISSIVAIEQASHESLGCKEGRRTRGSIRTETKIGVGHRWGSIALICSELRNVWSLKQDSTYWNCQFVLHYSRLASWTLLARSEAGARDSWKSSKLIEPQKFQVQKFRLESSLMFGAWNFCTWHWVRKLCRGGSFRYIYIYIQLHSCHM